MKFDRIRMLTRRARLNMTQEALAAAAKVSLRSVAAWEAGTQIPTLRMVNKLSDALRVQSDWLLGSDPVASSEEHERPHETSSLKEDSSDPPLPPWGRDLYARLALLSPSLREKAVRQFHLTLDLLISANSEPYPGRSTYPDKAGSPDDVVAHRAMVGGLIAREQVRGRKATFATGQTTPDKPAASGQPLGTKGP